MHTKNEDDENAKAMADYLESLPMTISGCVNLEEGQESNLHSLNQNVIKAIKPKRLGNQSMYENYITGDLLSKRHFNKLISNGSGKGKTDQTQEIMKKSKLKIHNGYMSKSIMSQIADFNKDKSAGKETPTNIYRNSNHIKSMVHATPKSIENLNAK